MATKLYEVINPSDAMTMHAASIEIAAAACAMLGGGKIGAREVSNNEEAERTPVLFGWDEWLRDRSMLPLGPWILAHEAEIVAALRSVMLGSPADRADLDHMLAALPDDAARAAFIVARNDRRRSSMSDWEKAAHTMAASLEAKSKGSEVTNG